MTTIDRQNGEPRATLIDLVRWDEETGTAFVAYDSVAPSNWALDILENGAATVQVSGNRIATDPRLLAFGERLELLGRLGAESVIERVGIIVLPPLLSDTGRSP